MRIAVPLLSYRHRSAILAACLILVGTVLGAGPSFLPDQAPPDSPAAGARIAVDPPSFDFGKVLPQKSLTREFNIRSFGAQDLVIENVSTTCGCTVADNLAKKVVKPGGSQPLRVTLTTPANPGPITKSVMVRSNDPVRPLLEIKLKATVVAETP
jgi:hypothetical protein